MKEAKHGRHIEALRASMERSASYGGMGAARARGLWLTTFTDLTALMLTFFVLQFSMSRVDQVQWQNLTNSFQERLLKITKSEVPVPQDSHSAAAPERLRGDDLSYLSSVIRHHLRHSGLTKRLILREEADRLLLSLEVPDFDVSWNASLDPVLTPIATLLNRLENKIELRVKLTGKGVDRPYRPGLAAIKLADQLQAEMRHRGVRNLSTIKAYVNHDDAEPAAPRSRPVLEFLIYSHTGEP